MNLNAATFLKKGPFFFVELFYAFFLLQSNTAEYKSDYKRQGSGCYIASKKGKLSHFFPPKNSSFNIDLNDF